MRTLTLGFLLLAAGHATAASSFTQEWPSCDIKAQHDVKGETGSIKDPLQAHISVRINVLQADIGNARKARHLTEAQSEQLWQQAGRVRKDADGYVKQQGFLSAAERASYDRELDDVAGRLCRAVK
ncbi:hypothetical protein ABEG74_22015 [Pantoea agglomerans]|jgi:hypothetical protein|uniref:hypothetical protein n=1 Tax=Pantoea TaxID=53335 RepID=UPI00289CE92C|nr:hypothetical protein [Pantoea agglomerans]WNK69671.1 hypothetical protein RM156_22890 [Pantoea agglomerans]